MGNLFVLTVINGLLLPPTLAAGILGMNVTELPYSREPSGFT